MDNQNKLVESHHGVLMNVDGHGVLIIGPPAIGKSSLALELLSQHHQLIADDIVDFYFTNDIIVGQCPMLLAGLLHTRELGLISVSTVFGDKAWQRQHHIDYVIELTQHANSKVNLSLDDQTYTILNKPFPLLTLSVTNPASLSTRLLCWLTMQLSQYRAEKALTQRQHMLMSLVK